MANKKDVSDAAYKLARLVNGGVVGYYTGGKTSQIMSKTLPQDIVSVVEKHKKIQLGASLAQSFVPGAGVVAMGAAVASIWKMYYDINKVLGITISDNAGKSLTSALITNLASFGARGIATTVSEGAKFIPLVGWLASAAITTTTTTAIIYGSAFLYLNALIKMYEAEGKFDLAYLESVVGSANDSSNPRVDRNSNSIEERVREIIVDKLGVEESEVIMDASFTDDLGADDFDTVELIMEFEKVFGITIPDDQAERIATVADAVYYIEANA